MFQATYHFPCNSGTQNQMRGGRTKRRRNKYAARSSIPLSSISHSILCQPRGLSNLISATGNSSHRVRQSRWRSRAPLLYPCSLVVAAILGVTPALCEADRPSPLVEPLLETARTHEGKQILVIFTARWDTSGDVLKKLMEDEEVGGVLKSDGVVSYVADCTERTGVGATEMRKHGVNAIPHSALLLHSDGMLTFTRLDLTSSKTLASNLRALIEKGKQGRPDVENRSSK